MSESTKPIDDRLLRVAVLAADLWAMDNDSVQMTNADRTRGIVRTAVTHLIDQGLLTVPDDISERLDQPISIRWEHGETTTVTRYGRPSFRVTPIPTETSMSLADLRDQITASITLVSANPGDVIDGIEISDPDCPVEYSDLPQVARDWMTDQGWGADAEDELLYVLTEGAEVPAGFPVFVVEQSTIKADGYREV